MVLRGAVEPPHRVFLSRFDSESQPPGKVRAPPRLLPAFDQFVLPAAVTRRFTSIRPGTEASVNTTVPSDCMVVHDAPGAVRYSGVREDSRSKFVILVPEAAAATSAGAGAGAGAGTGSSGEGVVYRVLPVTTSYVFTREFAVKELGPEEVKKVWEAHQKQLARQGPAYVPLRDPRKALAATEELTEEDELQMLAVQSYRCGAGGWLSGGGVCWPCPMEGGGGGAGPGGANTHTPTHTYIHTQTHTQTHTRMHARAPQ
jgi:hypothetical protein